MEATLQTCVPEFFSGINDHFLLQVGHVTIIRLYGQKIHGTGWSCDYNTTVWQDKSSQLVGGAKNPCDALLAHSLDVSRLVLTHAEAFTTILYKMFAADLTTGSSWRPWGGGEWSWSCLVGEMEEKVYGF